MAIGIKGLLALLLVFFIVMGIFIYLARKSSQRLENEPRVPIHQLSEKQLKRKLRELQR